MDDQTFASETPRHSQASVPSLSRPFLSADDAARYAHEQVGGRREREYVACIFRRNDQRFVVTEPLQRERDWSDPRQLYPANEKGSPMFPDNHVLHGFFLSHVALSVPNPWYAQMVNALAWTRKDAMTSLMMFSVDELRHLLVDEVPAYLSGAQDSLIMFNPDRTRSAQLLGLLGTTQTPGELARNYEKGIVNPGKFTRETAAYGDLQVLVSNGRWNRGKMTQDINLGPWERSVPERVAFGALFASADEAALDCHSRYAGRLNEEQTWFGFILKRKGKEEYVATELVPVSGTRDKLFSLRSLFGLTGARQYIYPDSFQSHSYFYSRQSVKTLPEPANNWLARHFIVPLDLFVVIYNSRKHPLVETKSNIPLYLSNQDGALLKYVARKGTRLFDNDTQGMGVEVFRGGLSSGVLTPTDFVRVIASNGELRVLRTSACWDRQEVVDRFWAPSMNLQRRSLSPVFVNADDAAIHARSQLPSDTAGTFGGLILRRPDGFFVATDPIEVQRENFDIDWIFSDKSVTNGQFPAGCSIVSRYRSRGGRELPIMLSRVDKQVYCNMLSVDVVCNSNRKLQQADEYLFAPDGSIIRYRTGSWARILHDLAIALSSGNATPEGEIAKIKEQLYAGWLTPTAWVKKLARSGYLQVVVGSALWGQPRAVSEFEPFPEVPLSTEFALAISEPACSPVFVQEEAAARYAHERAGNRSTLSFGFILRYARGGAYIANLPIAVQGSTLAHDSVFPPGLLSSYVSQYVTSGIYLCAAQVPQNLPDHDYRHFVSPMDVNMALVSANTPQGYRPVYFSCADGALLRLELDSFDPKLYQDKFGQVEFRPNPFGSIKQAFSDWSDIEQGTFELERYIRRMARFGKLEVLQASAFWSRLGIVDQNWRPRMPAASADQLWAFNPVLALGPVFHHPDDAARYAHSRASLDARAPVRASAILANAETYSYIALEPLADPGHPNEIIKRIFRTASDTTTKWNNRPPRIPDGYKLVASHQLFQISDMPMTNESGDIEKNFPSSTMIYAHTHTLKSKGFDITTYYYSTRYGALLKYTPNFSRKEELLLLVSQKLKEGDKLVYTIAPEEYISRLADMGNLEVLKTAFYWRQAGRLGSGWKVTHQQEPPEISRHPVRDEL